MEEHPFAAYIRILGKGPNLSRDLTEDEAFAAMRMVLSGEVEPIQLGAFLCLLRVKTETEAEVAGLVRAARTALIRPGGTTPIDLDWPTYAGKTRRPPWYLVAARLLADHGVRVLLHGSAGQSPDRLHAEAILDVLSIPRVTGLAEAGDRMAQTSIAYIPLASMAPRLESLLNLRSVLGVRSPLNTALRQLNPLGAPYQVIGVAHPSYRQVHRAAAALLRQPHMAVFKGEGGEAERRPEKPCDVFHLHDGTMTEESFEVMAPGQVEAGSQALDPRYIAAVWRGEASDPLAEASVVGTAAIAIRLLGRASTQESAVSMAREWWRARSSVRPRAA